MVSCAVVIFITVREIVCKGYLWKVNICCVICLILVWAVTIVKNEIPYKCVACCDVTVIYIVKLCFVFVKCLTCEWSICQFRKSRCRSFLCESYCCCGVWSFFDSLEILSCNCNFCNGICLFKDFSARKFFNFTDCTVFKLGFISNFYSI